MGDDGMPTGTRIIGKDELRKMSNEYLQNKSKLNPDEIQPYLKLNFNRIWNQHEDDDESKQIEEQDAQQIIQELI